MGAGLGDEDYRLRGAGDGACGEVAEDQRRSGARVIVRWRFGTVTNAKVNGVAVQVQAGADGPSVEFDYAAESLVEWE